MEVLGSTGRVDLMLIDLAMPGMNGVEATRQVQERWPDLPVLFSTGYTDAVRFGGGEIDQNRIVGKPYRRDELSRKIDACLRRRSRAPGA
jgi:DNA-binding response OmpR family regulator